MDDNKDYTDGRWFATTMGQFLRILVDSGQDPCIIFRVDSDTMYKMGTFIRKMTVYSVPDGTVGFMIDSLGINHEGPHMIDNVLAKFIESGLVV